MCDIGRFEYHWIEGDKRLRKPLERTETGAFAPLDWHEAIARVSDKLAAAGQSRPEGVRFLLSAHAAHEELFLFRRLADELIGDPSAIHVSWRYREKSQPAGARFTVPPVEAPNVNGARLFGLVPGAVGERVRESDSGALRRALQDGRLAALYVFDPGPEGSLGDVEWIIDARRRGALPLLVVHGVQMTDIAQAADFVLPGASYVEKEASYTNEQGRLQGTARAMAPPGDALEDWQVLVNLATALGVPMGYTTSAHVRADIAARFGNVAGLQGLTTLAFARPLSAKHWLQASNPSERWKWDFMFQDLPPVKGAVDPTALPLAPGTIALREVK